MDSKKVATIVVTYNRFALLKECLQSLREQSFSDRDIIVVNNGSTDETQTWLSQQTDLIVINQENVGGAGGFFTGIKYACEHGYEYSWVMDDDVVADKDALANLMKHTDKVNGFLCSRILCLNGEMGNVPLISSAKSEQTNELLWGEALDDLMLRVDKASFVSVLIPTKVSREVGLPYRDYFIWGDDSEYTQRINCKYPSYMVIDSKVLHKRAIQRTISIFTETNKNRQKMFFYWYRNRIHMQLKFYNKLLFFSYSHLEVLKLLLQGKWWQSLVILKACWASLTFHPSVEFPANA